MQITGGGNNNNNNNIDPEGLTNVLNQVLRSDVFVREALGVHLELVNPMDVPTTFTLNQPNIIKIEFQNGYTAIPALSASASALQYLKLPNFNIVFVANQFYGLSSLKAISYQGEPYEDGTVKFPNNCSISSGNLLGLLPNIKKIIFHSFALNAIFATMSGLSDLVFLGNITVSANLIFTACPNITRQSLIDLFNALVDRTGLTASTITITAASYNRLTPADIAIATAKNFTIVSGT